MAEDGSHKLYKCYVCLFTCAVTRAIHLELVPDLSARSFLLAFRRFAARRGPVSVMYSDNAQTFRCVDRHLNILQSDPDIQDLLARRKLLWIYSASLAPWWGGFWERMVRSVKDLLRGTNGCSAPILGRTLFTFLWLLRIHTSFRWPRLFLPLSTSSFLPLSTSSFLLLLMQVFLYPRSVYCMLNSM